MISPNLFDLRDRDLRIPASVKPLFDQFMRDTHVTLGPDGLYYLTGTTPVPGRTNIWDYNDGIRLWRSPDLQRWDPLGLVYSLERDATWQSRFGGVCREGVSPTGEPYEGKTGAVWAPEIHYIRSRQTWMLAACISDHANRRSGSFLLRSRSGGAEGPYENIAACHDGPLDPHIDVSLFEDDDGTVYYLALNRFIARMRDDLSGLAEPLREVSQTPWAGEYWNEGVYLVKQGGKYHLCQTFWSRRNPDGSFEYAEARNDPERFSYDGIVASSDTIYGPYGQRYPAIVGGGHNNLFQDARGRWWTAIFGNPRGAAREVNAFDGTNAYLCRPMIVPMKWSDGRVMVDHRGNR
jgi:hypothetical protein